MYAKVIKIFNVGFPQLTWLLPVVILLAKEPVQDGVNGDRNAEKGKIEDEG